MPYPIFASTPGIIVENSDFDNSPANTPIVLLSYSSTIGDKIVVRDVSGRASEATPIVISTVGGASFIAATSTVTISSFKISEAFGRAAVSATTPFLYTILDAADFPHRPAPYAIKPWYENISTFNTYNASVISTFTVPALGPLEGIAFTTATGSADFTSTNADAISTTTLYSASNYTSSIYADALSTSVLRVGSFTADSIDGGYMRLEGHMATTGNTYVGGNYSTIVGNLLNTYDFSAQSNVTVGDAFSTLGNFYAAGPITSRGTFTIGGEVSATTLVSLEAAAHASTVYVGGSFKGANYVGVAATQASSIAVGTAALPAYSADVGGSLFSKDMFITAESASTTTISTAVLGLSTIRISNGLGAFNDIYADSGTLYYNGSVVGAIGTGTGVYGVNTAVDYLFVSSFTSTASTYASTLLAGSNEFATEPPVQMEVDGGIRASLVSTPSRAVTHLMVGLAGGTNTQSSIRYSIDNGLTFSPVVSGGFTATNRWGFSAAYNGSLWLVGGEGSLLNSIKYSTDGSNFSNIVSGGFTTQCNTLKWNGRMWVAVGITGAATSTIQYSYDGSNWTGVTNGFAAGAGAGGGGLAWNGRVWAAIGSNDPNTSIKYSYDGINWSNAATGGSFFVGPRTMATNGRTFIAAGSNSSRAQWAAISSNAINWTYVDTGYGAGTGIRNVLWDGNMWIVTTQFTGTQNQSMRCSFNGINWFALSNQTNYKGGFSPMIYDGSRYFLPGQNGSTTTFSYNLINWSDCVGTSFGGTNSAYNIAFRENFDPIMKVNNLDVRTAQGHPQYNDIASTNTIFSRFSGFSSALTHSTTMYINNTMGINPPSGVGINGCISSLNYALFVYGSTFTNDPNPVKLGGGNWTTVSDSNLKNEYPIDRDILHSNIATSFENVKLKEFNYKKSMVPVYVNPAAIDRRNNKIQAAKDNLRSFTNIEPYTGSNFQEINTETEMMRQNGFIAQEVAQHIPNATVNFPMGDSNYLGIDMDQLNMIHLAATQHLMSTIECQHSTLRGQEDQMATIFENFEILRAIGNNI